MFGIQAILTQGLFKLGLALFAILMVRYTLKWLDKKMGVQPFKVWINEADPMVKAHYYGFRFIGVCLLVGLAIS